MITPRLAADFRAEHFDAPVVRTLDALIHDEYLKRYGGGDETVLSADDFEPPNGVFYVGYVNDDPVACGGWRAHGDDAEMKRVFVAAHARRLGLAKHVIQLLEEDARRAGRRRMVLESGTGQPEALALYAELGYRNVTPFGFYANEPDARHLGKDLQLHPRGELSSAK